MKNKKVKCDIYTRVSTTMQVDGYSLDAQKEKLKRYAEFQNMEIVNEYSDEGKSGKSIEGRTEFQRMLDNIENGTDEVQFVLVFKLSRFGRNAADVLNSLQRMQDFGVNLICVEDGIDSSKDSGKLMRLNERISLFRQWRDVSRKPEKENGTVDLLHMVMN
jgi:site-specific DNA recombinase